jgi:hypothetical protein
VQFGLSATCQWIEILPAAGWCVKQIMAIRKRQTILTRFGAAVQGVRRIGAGELGGKQLFLDCFGCDRRRIEGRTTWIAEIWRSRGVMRKKPT